MQLMRPYPDELVGSLLSRAMRQMGLSQKRLIPLLTGRNISSHSSVITSHAGIARAFGMDLEEFIRNHTLLPYTTAFMPQHDRDRIVTSVLANHHNICTAAISQNATKAISHLKLCATCKAEDLKRYGETYWRRSHQLPGVLLCSTHERFLHLSNAEVRSRRPIVPPNEALSVRANTYRVPQDTLAQISRFSEQALRWQFPSRDWTEHYRDLASKTGYALRSGQIFGEVLSLDLGAFYGEPYLDALGAKIYVDRRNAWPALLVRASGPNSTALKHVLLNVFLLSSPRPSRPPAEYEHRKKARPRDWAHIQRKAITKLEEEVARCQEDGRRITVKELATRADISALLHHHRQKMPILAAWLEAFKATPQSERQTGKRPRTYKKKSG